MDRELFERSKARMRIAIEENLADLQIRNEARCLLASYDEDGNGYGALAAIESWMLDTDTSSELSEGLRALEREHEFDKEHMPAEIAALPTIEAVRAELRPIVAMKALEVYALPAEEKQKLDYRRHWLCRRLSDFLEGRARVQAPEGRNQ